MHPDKVNLAERFSRFTGHWKPKIVGDLNGQQVKLVKFRGPFVWHAHKAEDVLFLAVKGAFEPKAKKASKGGGPSVWLCQRRWREWPSLFIHNFFSLDVERPSPKAPRFHRGIWVMDWPCLGWRRRFPPGRLFLLSGAGFSFALRCRSQTERSVRLSGPSPLRHGPAKPRLALGALFPPIQSGGQCPQSLGGWQRGDSHQRDS